MKISFLFPSKPHKPIGGYKIAFEYANKLADDGYEVSLLYPIHLNMPKGIWRKIYDVMRYIKFKNRFSSNVWFPINPKVKETVVFDFNTLPDSDAYICTSVETAMALHRAKVSDESRKFYFIQGFENWNVPDIQVFDTYRYPFAKIVISPYLESLVKSQGQECIYVPNGFSHEEYSLTIPIKNKEQATVSILYHTQETKDFATGLKAICIAKKKHPELKALIFGAYDKPVGLPEWCEFYHNPDLKTHNEINNRAAIYVGPSRLEGFGLTIGEAMMCGQAVACTDIPGYTVLAINNKNALASTAGDAEALSQNIIRLIEDQNLRIRIAEEGYRFIQDFTMEKAYLRFKEAIESEFAKIS